MSAQPNSVPFTGLPPEYKIPAHPPSLQQARAYCAHLAHTHYENFSVVTWFLPARLHQHFYNVYAYCRIADDLADETGDAAQSLRLLDEWESQLNECYGGSPRHPVFVALAESIRHFDIPRQPFADLLTAFRRDQNTARYPTFGEVLDYCRFSANPVGRLVLYLCGYRDAERQHLSDYTCTALQLANFWQDIVPDYGKGRIYLPLEDLQRYGVVEEDIAARRATLQFRELMRFEVDRTWSWFERGLPLASSLDPELALDIELFTRGGQQILRAIERQNYDVLRRRPALSRSRKLLLVLRAAARKFLS